MEKLSLNPNIASRIQSIDLLRGLVMIIMALDHVRDYFHAAAFLYDPTDLSRTSAPIFFTRWVTHYCAPIFVFLSGTSAYLMSRRKSKKELSLFLLKRGLWLLFLELVVLAFGWNFDIHFHSILLITIWMFGISMIVLAALVHLQLTTILIIGLALVLGHNLLDTINVDGNDLQAFLWAVLHKQAGFSYAGKTILVGFPVIPWIGVMPLGYCLGSLYTSGYDPVKRKKILLWTGSLAILLFLVLRITNLYGDSALWAEQSSPLFTFLSFLNVSKYPPSLLYLLVTLGPALLFLAFTERVSGKISDVILVYGRVPLFYYLIHIYLIHVLAVFAAILLPEFSWSVMIMEEPIWFTAELKGFGFPLYVVYLVWAGVVVSLYPLCKWYDKYKRNNKEKWWLSYL